MTCMACPNTAMFDFQNTLDKEYGTVLKQIAADTGLSCVQANVLLYIANHPPCCTSAEIVRAKKISKAHVSLAVEALLQKGYLCRGECSGRCVKLQITEAAAPAVQAGRKRQAAFTEKMYKGFSPEEMAAFSRFFQRVRNNLQQQGE